MEEFLMLIQSSMEFSKMWISRLFFSAYDRFFYNSKEWQVKYLKVEIIYNYNAPYLF